MIKTKQATSVISLQTKQSTATASWLLDPKNKENEAVYGARHGIEITPLINGQIAFEAIEKALETATGSIDIICWGFDPSLRLSGPSGSIRYGELLRQKAAQGIEVRVMIWYSIAADVFPDFVDESLPDIDGKSTHKAAEKEALELKKLDKMDKYIEEQTAWKMQYSKDKSKEAMFERMGEAQHKSIQLKRAQVLARQSERLGQRSQKQEKAFAKYQQARKKYEGAEEDYRTNNVGKVYPQPGHFDTSTKEGKADYESFARDAKGWLENKLKENRTKSKKEFEALYNQAYTKDNGSPWFREEDKRFNEQWYTKVQAGEYKNLYFNTRDFKNSAATVSSMLDSEESAGKVQFGIGAFTATHHQKCVIIDYAQPAKSVAFVMGHNMQKNYYDTSQHKYLDSENRYVGFRPWHDLSTRVRGPVLIDLNDNFSKAWDKEIEFEQDLKYISLFPGAVLADELINGEKNDRKKGKIGNSRDHITLADFQPIKYTALDKLPAFSCAQAQVCRTQTNYNDRSIRRIYQRALQNAFDHIYTENQYFRYSTFAEKVKEIAKKHQDEGAISDLYWFVVTNKPNSPGEAGNTYNMLRTLGQQERLPKIAADDTKRLVEINEQITSLENVKLKQSEKKQYSPFGIIGSGLDESLALLKAEQEELLAIIPQQDIIQAEQKANQALQDESNVDDPQKAFALKNIPGLKLHIATLESCSAPIQSSPGFESSSANPHLYTQIYVHSKLLTVDDAFFTLGSANINKRSFEVDTELNIAADNPAIAKHFRETLWGMHTESLNISTKRNFNDWDRLMTDNWRARYRGDKLIGRLQHFFDASSEPNQTRQD